MLTYYVRITIIMQSLKQTDKITSLATIFYCLQLLRVADAITAPIIVTYHP
jgi:hypothetical protein